VHDVRSNLLRTILNNGSLLPKLSDDHADGVDFEDVRTGLKETLIGLLACVMVAHVGEVTHLGVKEED
jgi:hypothetical protein